ncbi:uncharacterized protein LOC18437369 isoform X2 [Amborella trichopoda]|uniref:uncharacterized protein LOC18437369 isoform X2 n=1 Tax=Amborella trichopoda TaxID=13333 RepID=UPI0009C07C8B|nr:uncharacterized protein LOC18437369 isoform X2 [Amborella trichopoda]|eukprot:XP_020524726.1 uncharacterized protein LOC18437369 isoform X2 [Amborella trichopoda]
MRSTTLTLHQTRVQMGSFRNPCQWQFTWEAFCHNSFLRLFLFTPSLSLKSHYFSNITATVETLKSHSNAYSLQTLLVRWLEEEETSYNGNHLVDVSLRVPVPRVLLDLGFPPEVKVLEGYVEIKLVLLLPVDHPLVNDFIAVSHDCDTEDQEGSIDGIMDTDINKLSSMGEVHFYCKSCSMKLTRQSLRSFVEMPSVNWRESADNWFGSCCCSFGGASEKLASVYENSLYCMKGICHLDCTSVVICKDDLTDHPFSDNESKTKKHEAQIDPVNTNKFTGLNLESGKLEKLGQFCGNECAGNGHFFEEMVKSLTVKESSVGFLGAREHGEGNNFNYSNASLGSGFIIRVSSTANSVRWTEFLCAQCSLLVGSYPSVGEDKFPLDDGIRLFKCHISTSDKVGGPDDIFRNHTLQRVFVKHLLDSARDEVSYRTVIRDIRTKLPVLQLILVNPKVWSCTGNCWDTNGDIGEAALPHVKPVVKVLFRDHDLTTKDESRLVDEWSTKMEADEIYMMTQDIRDLVAFLKSAQARLPYSCSLLQGMFLSYLESLWC